MAVETLDLYEHQQQLVDRIYAAYGAGAQRLAAVVPCGGGKTVLGTRPVADSVRAGRPALWLAHRTELIEQAEEKLRGNTAGLGVGVLQGARREVHMPTIVGSVPTATKPGALNLLRQLNLGLIVVDECHHAAARSYQNILHELGAFRPDGPRVLGLTATLGRADGLALGDTFQEAIEGASIGDLIGLGFLLRPKGVRVKVEGLDFSRVKRSRTSDSGLDDRAVASAMTDALAPAAIARAVIEHGKGRKGVAFLPSVELSKEQARVFAEHGLRSTHVDADTPKAVRREIMRRVRLGEYDMVCNVGLFTEGTDVPVWDMVVLGRPTSSENLFIQMAMRGGRPYPGQSDFLVLDVVGATGRHALRSIVKLDGVEMIDDLDDELKAFDEDEEIDLDASTEDSGGFTEPVSAADGPLVHELVDLFSASHTAWQRSPRGVWYLPTGDGRAVLLAPAHGVDLYDVRWSDGGLVHEDPCDITAAMSWGDKAARGVARRELDRAAAWRRKPVPRAQRMFAIYKGDSPGGEHAPLTHGALADVQDARWAATHIDTLPCVEQVNPFTGYWTT